MKKIIKILVVIVAAAVVWSLAPVCVLYLSKDPAPYTNQDAIDKLKAKAGERFGFIVLGDNHAGLIFNDSLALKLVRNINREERFTKLPIDFVAIAGDITNRGTAWDYRIFNRVRSLIKKPVICALGNHDNDSGSLELFRKYAGETEFSFADRNSYFIAIDNELSDLTEGQFQNLEKELEKSLAYKHRFIIAHKAPFSPYQPSWYRPELSPWSYRFMKLCEKYKVNMVFTGHEHMFKAQEFGGVKYVTTGGGGMLIQIPEADGGYPHYLVARVYGDYVDYEVRKIFPPLWEYLAYYLWKEVFYFLKGIVY